MMNILQVAPTISSRGPVVGADENIVARTDLALRRAAAASGREVTTSVLFFGTDPPGSLPDHESHHRVITGTPWNEANFDATDLVTELRGADTVYVNECLHPVGIFVAAHARLLGCRVIGTDTGAGDHSNLAHPPELPLIYDGFHAASRFATSCFDGWNVPVHLIPGPVDTEVFVPPATPRRDHRMVAAAGWLMPHKGFDRIIRALPTDLSLTIAGPPHDTEYVGHLRDIARGKAVTLIPGLDDPALRTLLQTAGLFVQASIHLDYRGNFHYKPELLGLAALEALSCGLPALVSNAGALSELANLPGCRCFDDDNILAAMLRSHAAGTLTHPPEQDLHAAVEACHGPLNFGRELLGILLENH